MKSVEHDLSDENEKWTALKEESGGRAHRGVLHRILI